MVRTLTLSDLAPPDAVTAVHRAVEASTPRAIAKDALRAIVEQLEVIDAKIHGLGSDKREVLGGAKSQGFDPKIIRKVLAIRRIERERYSEQQAMLAVYLDSLGMLSDTPLGQAAIARERAGR